ncbi:MAG: T9SS type A sorting domain-containing protein [Chitinophagaceae bacterium]|nr:MAG: T9SS type A sorting domain-containing protein [Chitinophagaceae bacterium]
MVNEINIVRYEVERSANGAQFAGIGSKSAEGMASYSQRDGNPLAADNFYRIKAIGLGNEVSYSAVVKVNADNSTDKVSIYPNPFTSQFTLKFNAAQTASATLRMVNMKGQVLYNRNISVKKGSNAILVEGLEDLPGGSYQVTLSNGDFDLQGPVQK